MWLPFLAEFQRAQALPDCYLGTELPCYLGSARRRALLRSLQRFEVGERGEGRIATEIDSVYLRGIDGDYRAALKLLVQDEKRHARILAGLVRALGGEPIPSTWTERLFVRGRRLCGIRLKLLVLLAAEVVGVGFYGMCAAKLPPGPLAAALRSICADESRHLRFHCAFFRTQVRGFFSRAVFRLAWWAVACTACALLLFDHRPAFEAMRVPILQAADRFWRLIAAADRAVVVP